MNAIKRSLMILTAAILIAAAPSESTTFAAQKTGFDTVQNYGKHKHKKHKKHKKSTKNTTNDKTKGNNNKK